jgi:hypothetical protein
MTMLENDPRQLSLPLQEFASAPCVDSTLPLLPQATIYSLADIKAAKQRQEDAKHFARILELVKHFN